MRDDNVSALRDLATGLEPDVEARQRMRARLMAHIAQHADPAFTDDATSLARARRRPRRAAIAVAVAVAMSAVATAVGATALLQEEPVSQQFGVASNGTTVLSTDDGRTEITPSSDDGSFCIERSGVVAPQFEFSGCGGDVPDSGLLTWWGCTTGVDGMSLTIMLFGVVTKDVESVTLHLSNGEQVPLDITGQTLSWTIDSREPRPHSIQNTRSGRTFDTDASNVNLCS